MSKQYSNYEGKTNGSNDNSQTENSIGNVNSASKGKRHRSPDWIMSGIALIISVVSMATSITSCQETSKTRNESYKAVIAANPVEESMAVKSEATSAAFVNALREEGEITNYVTGYATPLLSSQGEIAHEILSFSDLRTYPINTPIEFANIGPGMAINVRFIWDDENFNELYHTLLEANDKADKYVLNDGTYFLYSPTRFYQNDNSLSPDATLKIHADNTEYSYMRCNYEETYTVGLPILYSILFSDILLHDPLAKPSVKLTVEFSDTQGIEYYELITLTVSNPLAINLFSEDGSKQNQSGITYTINVNHNTPVRK